MALPCHYISRDARVQRTLFTVKPTYSLAGDIEVKLREPITATRLRAPLNLRFVYDVGRLFRDSYASLGGGGGGVVKVLGGMRDGLNI